MARRTPLLDRLRAARAAFAQDERPRRVVPRRRGVLNAQPLSRRRQPLPLPLEKGRRPRTTASGIQTAVLGPTGASPRWYTDAYEAAPDELPYLYAVQNRIAEQAASAAWHLERAVGSKNRRKGILRTIEKATAGWKRHETIEGLRKEGDVRSMDEHPLLSALYGASSVFTGRQVRLLFFKYRLLTGEVPLVAERRFGVPVHLIPVPPSWMKETPTKKSPFYLFRYGDWEGKVRARDVFLHTNPCTSNPFGRGSSVTRALASELELTDASTSHLLRFFFGGALPTVLITGKGLGERGQDEREADLVHKWNSDLRRSGMFNPLTWPAEVDTHTLGSSFQDLQVGEFRKTLRDAIFQCFGMPPELMGELGSANRSTIELARLIFTVFTLVPELDGFQDFVQHRILPEYPGNDGSVWLHHDVVVHEDEEQMVRRMRVGPQVGTLNEWRGFYGQEPVEQGEKMWVMREGFKVVDDVFDLLKLNREPKKSDPEAVN